MKRYFLLFILVFIAVFSVLPDTVETIPKPKARYARPFLPEHWFSIETEGCPCGYMCYYNMWIPKFEVGPPGLWVFGVTPWEQQGGTLHFRQYPDRDCEQHCFDCPPILYTADVIYIRYYGGDYPDIAPEDVHLTYIPPGKYVLTSQNFTLYHNAKIWWFADDGTGPKGMSAHLETDKPVYEVGEMVHLFLQVTDQDTEEPIQVDSITGEIVLPDQTRRTITTDMWAWNSAEAQYEYTYNLKNDDGEYSDPQEGTYLASVTVEKAFYQDAGASCEFEVVEEKEGEFDCQFSEGEIEELATMYAPYMCFYRDIGEEEKYYPTYAELMLDMSMFWKYEFSERTRIYDYDLASDKGEFISNYGPDYYLDLVPEGPEIQSYLLQYQKNHRNVYCRVACFQYEGKPYIVVQYWLFYIFNKHFLNDHEGEWEMILVVLDYHTRAPVGAAYSRHLSGEYRPWSEVRKEEGTHPVVFVAKGSHGAYFTEGMFGYQGTFDVTSDDGWKGTPSTQILLLDQLWLHFGGNWGYRSINPFASGPHGPLYQEQKWSNPIEWAFALEHNHPDTLRSPYTLFSLSCPADMLITDNAGRRLGFDNGEFVQEIPNSYVQNCDEEELYVITGNDQYRVEILGTGEGTFNLAYTINSWNTAKTMKYCNVPVNELTRAIIDPDSDLVLIVDANQDGLPDFAVSPISIELSSPQPIQPLQIGEEITYEMILTNHGDQSDFRLEVDLPLSWSYSLSCDTVTLNPHESATVLLTVTHPTGIPVQDYVIRVEAISLGDSQMTASLDLIASSKAELVAENMRVVCEEEDIVLTALISNMGLQDAENVKVQFFNGPPFSDNLLGEQIIHVPSGESVISSINCTLSDGLYALYVVVDPDNLISESCEYNNELSIEYLLDRTPPEAEIFFDPAIEDLAVRGVDNLDLSVNISLTEKVIKNKVVRTYVLTDDAGNTTELQLEVKHHKHEIKAEIIDMKYNGKPVNIPQNSLKIEYIIENGEVKMLNQFLKIEDIRVHLIYNRNRNQTKIIMDGKEENQEGLMFIIFQPWRGEFQYEIKKM
jgi:hypothetical protein